MKSSQNVLDAIPRVESWLKALKDPKVQFSRWQAAKDLIDLATLVMYDDGIALGRAKFAHELKEKIKKGRSVMVIHKIRLLPDTTVDLPENAQVLSAHNQGEGICIWYAYDEGYKMQTPRRFVCIPTGKQFSEMGVFIGTVLLAGGSLVFHVFEVK